MRTQQDYRERITIEPGKRGGKPCISHAEIIDDFPELEEADILAALQFAN